MIPCRWAGTPCPNSASAIVTIAGVGQRSVCAEHRAVLDRLGMAYSEHQADSDASPRASLSVAPRWLTRLQAKDMTGSLS